MLALAAQAVFAQALDDAGDLEDAELVRVGLVLVDIADHRRHHRAAQHDVVGGHRVDDADVVLDLDVQLLVFLRVAPDVRVYLVQAVALDEQVLRKAVVVAARGAQHRRERALRRGDLEVVVAVDACDFLDDVGLDRDVLRRAPRGHVHGEGLAGKARVEAERVQRVENLLVGNIDTGVTIHILFVKAEVDLIVVAHINVGHGGNDLHTRIDFGEQLHEMFDRRRCDLGVERLFIAH